MRESGLLPPRSRAKSECVDLPRYYADSGHSVMIAVSRPLLEPERVQSSTLPLQRPGRAREPNRSDSAGRSVSRGDRRSTGEPSRCRFWELPAISIGVVLTKTPSVVICGRSGSPRYKQITTVESREVLYSPTHGQQPRRARYSQLPIA